PLARGDLEKVERGALAEDPLDHSQAKGRDRRISHSGLSARRKMATRREYAVSRRRSCSVIWIAALTAYSLRACKSRRISARVMMASFNQARSCSVNRPWTMLEAAGSAVVSLVTGRNGGRWWGGGLSIDSR